MAGACPNILNPPPITQRIAGFQEEIQFEVLRRLHKAPHLSQRALARELGISLGSINFCFKALMEKGWIKMHTFNKSEHKLHYIYLLTPTGITEKSNLTAKFLSRKMAEFESLQKEIESLKADL